MVVKQHTEYIISGVELLHMLTVLVAAVVALTLLKSCQKDEFIHPVIHTGEVSGITSEGARFHGRIIMHSDVKVLDHGFVWGKTKDPEINHAYTMSQGEPVSADFSLDVHSTLQENQTYYVRAFAMNESFIWYGRQVSFFSLGSKAPIIYEVSPLSGTWGDTLTMKGKYFSFEGEENHVFLGPRCDLTYSSDSLLRFVVPHTLDTVEAHVKIAIAGNEVRYEEAFVLDPPVIQNYSPKEGTFQTQVTISGKNFHEHYTNVFLGDHEADLLEVSDSLIAFTLPTGVPGGNNELRVQVLTQPAVADNEFLYRSPVITAIYPEEGTWRDTISITGTDLVLDGYQTNVTFENHHAEIILAEPELLKVIVSDDLRMSYSWVRVTANEQTSSGKYFTLLPPLVHHVAPEEAWFGQLIEIHGEYFHPNRVNNQVHFGDVAAYINPGSNTGSLLKVFVPNTLNQINSTIKVKSGWQITHVEQSFHLKEHEVDSLSSLYGSRRESVRIYGQGFTGNTDVLTVRVDETEAAIQSAGTNAILFRPRFGAPHGYNPVSLEILGRTVESPEMFFLYEPFEQKSGIPYGGARPPVRFIIDDHIYIGGGRGHAYYGTKHFWKYDPQNDNWEKQAYLPVNATIDHLSFAVNGNGYLLAEKQLFRYDPSLDSWTEQGLFPGFAAWGKSAFTLNGYVYVGCGVGDTDDKALETSNELWRYDPHADSWLQLADLPFNPFGTGNVMHSTGFAIQDKGYMKPDIFSMFWEYDPAIDQWQEKIDLGNHIPNAVRRGMSVLVIDEDGTKIYLSGGNIYHTAAGLGDMYVWDIEEGTVDEIVPLRSPRGFHFSIPYQGKGFIGGGWSWSFIRDDMYLFDPEKLPPIDR